MLNIAKGSLLGPVCLQISTILLVSYLAICDPVAIIANELGHDQSQSQSYCGKFGSARWPFILQSLDLGERLQHGDA